MKKITLLCIFFILSFGFNVSAELIAEEDIFFEEINIVKSEVSGTELEPTFERDDYTTNSIKPTIERPGGGGIFSFRTAVSIGGKTANHSTSSARSLPATSSTYSSKDLISEGKVKQRRYYDGSGRAIRDVDYFHGDDGTHTFPHIHYITWPSGKFVRSGAYPAQF